MSGGTDAPRLAPLLRDEGAAVAAALPRSRRVQLPGAARDPWLEQPTAFFDRMRVFVRVAGVVPGVDLSR